MVENRPGATSPNFGAQSRHRAEDHPRLCYLVPNLLLINLLIGPLIGANETPFRGAGLRNAVHIDVLPGIACVEGPLQDAG